MKRAVCGSRLILLLVAYSSLTLSSLAAQNTGAAPVDASTKKLDYLNNEIAHHPNKASAYIRRARLEDDLTGSGKLKYDAAIDDYTTAIKLCPRPARLYVERACLYSMGREFQKSIQDCDEAIKLARRPSEVGLMLNNWPRWNVAANFIGVGSLADALNLFKMPRLLCGYLGDSAYTIRIKALTASGQYQDSISACNNFLKLLSKKNVLQQCGVYALRADAYEGLGEHEKAIEDCTAKIVLESLFVPYRCSEGYYERAEMYVTQKRYNNAIDDYTQAISNNSSSGTPDFLLYLGRAKTYSLLQQYQLAVDDYSNVVRLCPDGLFAKIAYDERSGVYLELKQYAQAIDDLKKTYVQEVKLEPEDQFHSLPRLVDRYLLIKDESDTLADALNGNSELPAQANTGSGASLEDLTHQLSQQNWQAQQASEAIRKRLYPKGSLTAADAAKQQYSQWQQQQQIDFYTQIIIADPKDAITYRYRSEAETNLRQYEQALDDINHAITIKPNDVVSLIDRGEIYVKTKKYQEALQDFSHAISLSPNNLGAYSKRAQVYECLGDTRLASKDYATAEEMMWPTH